jgi:glycosyltransferase involved in cell wall biosynthesis
MRILCAAAAYPPLGKGGGPKASEAFARALLARGHTVRVVTVGGGESLELRDGIEVKTLPTLNLYWNYWVKRSAAARLIWHALENFNPRALMRMRREIAAFDPDVVVTLSIENVNVATWIAAWLMGRPSVHVIHSYFLLCWRGTMFARDKNCARPCMQCQVASIGKKLCSRVVDGVIAEAAHSLSVHRRHGFFRRAVAKVIPGAVIGPESPRPFRAHENVAIKVGYIGMLTPNKGIGTLADAAAALGPGAPFEYIVAGDGEPNFVQQVLARFPAALTTYLGWTNPHAFYPQIDVLVVPSTWAEPFGNVCVEALSNGVPVIVARSGALPELIESEVSGLVFTAGDHAELAGRLRQIADDRILLERMHFGAIERAKRYSPEALASSVDAFLVQVEAATAAKKSARARRPALGRHSASRPRA